jgi:hypothetical protein
LQLIEHELEGFGIRLNKKPPNITFKRKDKGGIAFTSSVQVGVGIVRIVSVCGVVIHWLSTFKRKGKGGIALTSSVQVGWCIHRASRMNSVC